MAKSLLKIVVLVLFFSMIGGFVWYKSDEQFSEKLNMQISPNGGALFFGKKQKKNELDSLRRHNYMHSSKSLVIQPVEWPALDSLIASEPDSATIIENSKSHQEVLPLEEPTPSDSAIAPSRKKKKKK